MVVGTPTSIILLLFRITALILGLTPKDFLIFIMVHLCTYIYIYMYIYIYIFFFQLRSEVMNYNIIASVSTCVLSKCRRYSL